MSISLTKGDLFTLADSNLTITLGLGWDARSSDGAPFDLDAVAFLLNAQDKVRSNDDFIFYNQTLSKCGGVSHQGDNRIGDADGDDEKIEIQLSKIPQEIQKIVFTVTIHEYDKRNQNFGQVRKAYIRLINQKSRSEIARYDLTEDASTSSSMVFSCIQRENNVWKFHAISEGKMGGLLEVATSYGVKL
jgi:tellurium resistance protein TerD